MEYFSVRDAAKSLGITRNALYESIADGRIESQRMAGYVVITLHAIDEYRLRTQPDGVPRSGKPRKAVSGNE